MRHILGNILTAVLAASVALVAFGPTMADQFKYGNRVTQVGDMVPQSTAQATFGFQPIFGAGLSVGGPLVQTTSGAVAGKRTMVAGVATFNFAAFNVAPICNAIPEAADSSATANDYVVVTTTSCAYHSGDPADTRVVDFSPIVGNPN